MFTSLLNTASTGQLSIVTALICSGISLLLGILLAIIYMRHGVYTKNFVITLSLLPAIVQIVIMLVNGNLGTSVAVLGAFSLIRFRSVPGSAKEITSIFLAMAIGLATGMGYVTFAIVITLILCLIMFILYHSPFGEQPPSIRTLRITIPENLDYPEIFDDLFKSYTKKHHLDQVKTTNLGSMYELTYQIVLKNPQLEKEFIDALRCRNGNLTISCGRPQTTSESL